MARIVGIADEDVEAIIEDEEEERGRKDAGVTNDVALVVEVRTEEVPEVTLTGLDLSIPEVSEACLASAKTEEDLRQMIVVVSDPNSKVEKMWDLCHAYRFV